MATNWRDTLSVIGVAGSLMTIATYIGIIPHSITAEFTVIEPIRSNLVIVTIAFIVLVMILLYNVVVRRYEK